MSVTTPNLSIVASLNSGCAGISVYDATGTYNALSNPGGYGLPLGPAVNDVTTVTITLNYRDFGTTLVYVFTVASGVITACTLSLGGATPVDIFTALTSTVWPFAEELPFDLTADYGVEIPTFVDDIYSVTYQIEGDTVAPEAFDFSTLANLPVTCNTQLCADKKWASIDATCECKSEKYNEVMYIQSLIYQTISATTIGDLTGALAALGQAKQKCDTTDCGCGCS